MDLQLKDKVVIVTGGAKGIGAAAGRSFAAEGARVAIAGRSPIEGEALANEVDGIFVEAELARLVFVCLGVLHHNLTGLRLTDDPS